MKNPASDGNDGSGIEFRGYPQDCPQYRRISISLFLAGLATFALLYDTQPLLPLISADLGLSADHASLSVSASTIGLSVALLFAGPFSERHGRTGIIVASLFLSAVMGLVVAVAPSWHLHLLARFFLGIMVSGLPAVALAYLAEEITPSAQARAGGLYIAGTALGGMSGRLVTGVIADFAGWRVAVASIAILALLCAVTVWRLLLPSRGFTASQPGFANLWRQTAAILRDPVIGGLLVIAGTTMGAFVGVFNILGYRLTSSPYHLSVAASGLVFLVYALGSLASAYAGRLAAKWGQRRVLPGALMVTLIGVLLTLASPLPVLILATAIFTGGFFASHGVASGWVAARAKAGVGGTGQASSGYMVCYYAGSSVFGALAGTCWSLWGWAGVTAMASLLLGGATVIALLLRRTRPLGAR